MAQIHKISDNELLQAQVALMVAIVLQVIAWRINHGIFSGPQTFIVSTELVLALIIGFTINKQTMHDRGVHHNAALILLGLISTANISSFIIVLHLLLKRWSKNDKDFQFTQQDMKAEYSNWQPEFGDYLYLSLTNAINFAPADTKPLTHSAKMLMSAQALISVFTLALVLARSVTIIGT
jgi:hypothetical protein